MGRFACVLLAALAHVGFGSEAGSNKAQATRFIVGLLGLDKEREREGERQRNFEIAGAGFSRTGTKSLETALLQLGHKIYDTRSILEMKHTDRWVHIAADLESGNYTSFDQMVLEMEALGYTATLDFPMNLFAPAFAERRPASKVVMSIRETEDKWVDAWGVIQDILGNLHLRPWCWIVDVEWIRPVLKSMSGMVWEYQRYPKGLDRPLPWFEVYRRPPSMDIDDDRKEWVAVHKGLRNELEAKLPKDRFLAFNVRSGWAPLLDFLKIDDPALAATPFPHVNDRTSLETVRFVMDIVAVGLPVWLMLLAYLGWTLLRCVGRCFCGRPQQKAKIQ